jgi:tetratricopeptide (TPR) repeat protein
MARGYKTYKPAWVVALVILAILTLSGCASPVDKEAKFLEGGKRYLAKKDFQRAVLQFRNAIQAVPNDPEPHYQLSVAYLALGASVDAVNELKKAASLDPHHIPTQLRLAELMVTSNQRDVLEDARKRAQAVLETMPDNPDALTTRALANLRLGGGQGAEQDLEKALQIAPTYLRSSVLLTRLKLSEKDAAGAERVLREAVEKDPKAIDPVIALGELYRGLGRYPEAESQFQRALQLDPENGAAILELAAVQLAAGKKDLAEQTYKRASALPGGNKTIHAQYLLSQGNTDAAIAELKDLTRKDAKEREARSLLVSVYVATKRLPEATKTLSDALAKNPKDVDALYGRARIRLIAGQYQEAQQDLLPVLNLEPQWAAAHYLLAKAYQGQGAQGSYRQELEEALRRDPRHLTARLELASTLLAGNAAQAALDLMDQTPAPQKNSIPVLVQRNAALIGLGRWDEAGKSVEAGLKAERSPDLLLQEAVLKIRRKDFAGARKSAEEVLTLAPDNIRALDVLAGAYRMGGQATAGVRRLQEYAAQHPKSVSVQQYVAMILMSNGDRVQARALLAAAKAANPESVGVDLDIARLDLTENRTDEARKIVAAVLAKDGADRSALIMMADLEMKSANWSAAIGDYRKVLEKSPRDEFALNNLAYLLASQTTQLDEALKYAQLAKELAPNESAADDTIGWVHYRKGIYPTAVKYFEAAVSRRPVAAERYHLAMAYFKTGDRRRGTEQLEQALKMDPKLPEAAMAQQVRAETAQKPANR